MTRGESRALTNRTRCVETEESTRSHELISGLLRINNGNCTAAGQQRCNTSTLVVDKQAINSLSSSHWLVIQSSE